MPNARNSPEREPVTAEIDGNRLELIETGSDRLRILLELIGSARSSLRIIMYMFDPDRAGKAVRDALIAAASRGVDVALLVDGFGSRAPEDFFDKLEEAGGHYCLFNARIGRRYLVRNHQKLIVADERVAIIGGSNIDETYMVDTGPKHWRDLWLKIDGPKAAAAAEYFDSVFHWSKRRGARLSQIRRKVAEHNEWRGAIQWKFTGPLSMRNSWWRSIGRDMRHASRLDMIFAYFAPPGAMIRRIGRVGLRGRARIVTAAKSDNNTTIAAARHGYSRLLRRHVEIYEYERARLHTKLVVVDDKVHIGSSNFDYRSLYLNLEIMLRIKDAAFAEAMRRYFEDELKSCEWITPELHRRRANPWRRLKWAVSHFLVNLMDYTVTRRLNLRA